MLNKIIKISLHNRIMVLVAAVLALVMALPSLAHVAVMVPQTAAVVAVADGIVLAEMVAPV